MLQPEGFVNGDCMNIPLKNITRFVDPERTKALYGSLVNHSKESAAAYNFAKNLAMRERFVKEYFDPLGINPYLFQHLYVSGVNTYQQTVLYWGNYPVRLSNNDEVLCSIFQRNERDELAEVIQTSFGFTLFLDAWDGEIAICYEANLPWLLSPSIEKSKYENKFVLPEIDMENLCEYF